MTSKVKGFDRLCRQIEALPEVSRVRMGEALSGGANELCLKIKAAWRVPQLSEATVVVQVSGVRANGAANPVAAAGLSYQVKTTTTSIGKHVFNPRWEEFGTHPHSLYPGASRKTGRFQARGPHHPGATAHPAFWPTVRAWRKTMKSRVTRAGTQAAKDIAKL